MFSNCRCSTSKLPSSSEAEKLWLIQQKYHQMFNIIINMNSNFTRLPLGWWRWLPALFSWVQFPWTLLRLFFFSSSLLIVQKQSLVHANMSAGFFSFFFFFEVVFLRIMNASSSWRSIRSVSRWGLLKDSPRSWAFFVCVYAIIDRGRNKRHWTTHRVFNNKSLLKSTT